MQGGLRSSSASNSEEPYRSEIMEQMGKRTTELERLVTEMYVRQLSTRDVEEPSEQRMESCFSTGVRYLNFMKFPAGHHKSIRTKNLLERTFAEQKRWTKVIPWFFSEKSCMKLVFRTMIRISDKGREVNLSEYDLTLLRNLRNLIGWNESKYTDENEFISKKYTA